MKHKSHKYPGRKSDETLKKNAGKILEAKGYEVEYKHYAQQNILRRKVNQGRFQPLLEEITDFYVKFLPESCSVLYRIEIEKKKQIRGYIYMTNMVMK